MRLLIVKIGDIGDVVCALPMALAAKEKGMHLTWVVASAAKPLLELVGFVDEIVEVEGFEKRRWRSVLQAWRKIAFRKFDLILTPYRDRRYRLFSLFNWGECKSGFANGIYRPEVYLRFVSDGPVRWPKLPEKSRIFWVLAVGENSQKKGRHLRAWPVQNYQKLAKLLRARGEQVVITGVDPWARQFFEKSLIGEQSLPELMETFQRAKGVITHDSGALHLAKLAGARVVELFGPTRPEEVSHGEAVVAGPLSCQPCYDGKCYARCDRARCMEAITPEMVMEYVDRTGA